MAITRIANIANTIPDDSIQNAKLSNIVQSKNIIINGDMSIAQRDTSVSSVTGTDATCDRWRFAASSAGTWTISQSTTVPTGQGFATSFKADCTTANGSLSAGSILRFTQFIEGQNLQYLKKGTSSAESTTLSFWVKSSKTGTYIAELFDNDNDWSLEVHFYLVAGSTYSSGTLNTSWNSQTTADIAVGQVNLADSTSNEFYITGVQLEAGTAASDFEFLPVDVNERRCFRYFYMVGDEDEQGMGTAFYRSSSNVRFIILPPIRMRATPSLDQSTASNSFRVLSSGGDDLLDDWSIMSSTTDRFIICQNSTDASGTAGDAGYALINLANTHFALTSEFF